VDLEYVNVRSQSLDASINSIEDMLATKSNSIDHMPIIRHSHDSIQISLRSNRLVDTKEALRKDDEVLAWNVVLLDRLSYDNFGCSL
jgi:hypothetical protein